MRGGNGDGVWVRLGLGYGDLNVLFCVCLFVRNQYTIIAPMQVKYSLAQVSSFKSWQYFYWEGDESQVRKSGYVHAVKSHALSHHPQ